MLYFLPVLLSNIYSKSSNTVITTLVNQQKPTESLLNLIWLVTCIAVLKHNGQRNSKLF